VVNAIKRKHKANSGLDPLEIKYLNDVARNHQAVQDSSAKKNLSEKVKFLVNT
jgi:hypothetical protein